MAATWLALLLAAAPEACAQVCAPVQECGDVDASGALNTSDALSVLRKAVGHPGALTCQCGELPVCGNSLVEGEEDCEVGTLNGAKCPDLGFAGGTLACNAGCTFDTSACYAERFAEVGFGAVFDRRTELMWGIKVAPGGGATDPHDVDNFYTWSDGTGGTAADGTAFTDFLARLNDNCTVIGPGGSPTGSFAGRCDWRLPTIPELQSILLDPCPGEAGPCIDPIFGPVDASAPYWSTMTVAAEPTDAFVIGFSDGEHSQLSKSEAAHVLAVRGVRRGVTAHGELGCGVDQHGNEYCSPGSLCADPTGSGFKRCFVLCDVEDVGTPGSCKTGFRCLDVDPGEATIGGCVRY